MIFGPSWSHLDKKNFLWISNFFCEFFLSVLVIFYGKKILCLEMIFGPSWSIWDINFFCLKKNVSTLLGGFHHLALFFYGLNLRDLHQASGIWCKIGISSLLPQLDWPRSKKTGKITKQCYQTLFLGLMGFNTANNCKLHSDQVSRHSITKKCDFGPFFNFWPSPLKLDRGF